MVTVSNVQISSEIISHQITKDANLRNQQLNSARAEAALRIQSTNVENSVKDTMCQMLDLLLDHPVGLKVFLGKGLDGKSTQFFIKGSTNEKNELILWIMNEAPVVIATRERFNIFKRETQKLLRSKMRLASIPCGMMDDLLELDFSEADEILLFGIDLDEISIFNARQNAKENIQDDVSIKCDFHQGNAWNLKKFYNNLDLITSNGLNIYEKDDEKVTALYCEFFKALGSGGTLITSFLTPPPSFGGNTWKNCNEANLTKQRILFGTIIGVNWQNFRTEEVTRRQLTDAGFINIEIIYDSQGMFPTIIAHKT